MKLENIKITPDLAAEWLGKNIENNRAISMATVNQYAIDIIRGKWRSETGETIKFDRDGRLIDGQHRLKAIVTAQEAVTMQVVTGLEPEVIEVVDTGRKRSAADLLRINQVGYSANTAAVARKIILFLRDEKTSPLLADRMKTRSISNNEVLEFCRKNDVQKHGEFGGLTAQAAFHTYFKGSDFGFLHWYLSRPAGTEIEDVEKFLRSLATLDSVSMDSPIRTLHNKFLQSKTPISANDRLRFVSEAFEAWKQGKTNIKFWSGERNAARAQAA